MQMEIFLILGTVIPLMVLVALGYSYNASMSLLDTVSKQQISINRNLSDIAESFRYGGTLLSSGIAGCAVNRMGQVIYASTPFINLFGYESLSEIIGRPVSNFIPVDKRVEHGTFFADFILDEHTRRSMSGGRTVTALKKDGTEIYVSIQLGYTRDESGPYAIAIVTEDKQ